jgi:crotonobetainyl-CoA:carnitine CoA-transferase CaiB-like acyl-CoA transferase
MDRKRTKYGQQSELFDVRVLLTQRSFMKRLRGEQNDPHSREIRVQFRSDPMRIFGPAPSLGEHTHEILNEVLRLSDNEISQLDQSGITVERLQSGS